MHSLAQAIRNFQNGRLQYQEFLAEVERALSGERRDRASLMDILREEHGRSVLSPDVYAEVQRRIEAVTTSDNDAGEDAGQRMSSEKTEVQNGMRRERREPSLPKSAAHSYVQTSASHGPGGLNAITSPTAPPHGRDGGADGPLAGPHPGPQAGPHAGAAATKPSRGSAGQPAPTSTSTSTNAITLGPGIDEAGIPELERMKGVGDTLNGRFVLEECIGFGGMGTVYKALDLRKLEASDRKPYIAIKVLNVQFRGHPKSLIALQREARKAQALAHPNIVAVYDFDRDGSMVYLTMEYLVGQPLSRTLRAPDFNGMPAAEALPIVAGMAHALAYAHQRGFVHCDLKPANVFLTDRGDVKVIDFGIARVFQKPEEEAEATVFDAGSLGGLTPAYASPEMLEHKVPDPRDDIYALACITYELLTGRHPFDRMSATQARGTGMKPLRPKNLSLRQWRVLRCALSFERETRTPSVMRFLEEISDDRRLMIRIAAGGAAVVFVGLAAVAIGHYRDTPGDVVADGSTAQTPEGAASETRPPVSAPSTPTPSEKPPAPGAGQVQAPHSGLPPISMAAVTPVLAKVPCSALSASARENTIEVKGFVSQDYGVAKLKATLAKIPNVNNMTIDVQPVSEKECGVVNLFAPFWTKSRQSGASIRTRTADGHLTEGDPLVVDVTTPNYDTWVHVDYYVLDGGVVHLLPSLRARDNQAPPSYSATIGSFGNWIVSRPFGTELIVLITTPAPLFDGLRPEYETTPEYLRAMKKQLRQMNSKFGADRIAVEFVQINTQPRK